MGRQGQVRDCCSSSGSGSGHSSAICQGREHRMRSRLLGNADGLIVNLLNEVRVAILVEKTILLRTHKSDNENLQGCLHCIGNTVLCSPFRYQALQCIDNDFISYTS